MGLRQGCLLSLYLFLICADVLSYLLLNAAENKLLHGASFNRNNLMISHLLFTDDSLIFARATAEECKLLQAIFYQYTAALGQLFNLNKLSMYFNPNVQTSVIDEIKGIF